MDIHQTTPRSAINRNSFNVGSEAQVRIQQPSSEAVLLNRVTGGKLSEVAGAIMANGKIILVNPNGIIFHKGSIIKVNGILASTQDLNPNKFMTIQNLQLRFSNPLKIIKTLKLSLRRALQ